MVAAVDHSGKSLSFTLALFWYDWPLELGGRGVETLWPLTSVLWSFTDVNTLCTSIQCLHVIPQTETSQRDE